MLRTPTASPVTLMAVVSLISAVLLSACDQLHLSLNTLMRQYDWSTRLSVGGDHVVSSSCNGTPLSPPV